MSLTAIKYEGKKPYTDKTPLRNRWQPGDIKLVPEKDARVLCRFVEFKRSDAATTATDEAEAQAAIAASTQREDDERTETEGMLHLVETMDKDALEAYAAKYEVNLDKRRGLDKLRTEVVGLIEQFGAR